MYIVTNGNKETGLGNFPTLGPIQHLIRKPAKKCAQHIAN